MRSNYDCDWNIRFNLPCWKKLESLHSEEIQQNEKATYWMQEDICKWHIKHGVNKQIIQRTHTIQHDKTNLRNEKFWKNKRHFSKEDLWMANRQMKRCSTSLLEKCKSKPQWIITLHLSEYLSSKRQQKANVDKNVKKREYLYTADGTINWWNHYGKHH